MATCLASTDGVTRVTRRTGAAPETAHRSAVTRALSTICRVPRSFLGVMKQQTHGLVVTPGDGLCPRVPAFETAE
ncbi:hypothetical protein E4U53_004819, partial [Claviceps sorghi]